MGNFWEILLNSTRLRMGSLCFEELEALEEIISSGPWYVNGNIVGMDRWKIAFSPSSFKGELDIPLMGRWRITTIYGRKDVYKIRELWNGLEPHISTDGPMVIGGDFNCLLSKEDKKEGRRFLFSMGPKDKRSFMTTNDLHELGYVGPMFTWSNNKKRMDRIMERLDRMIVNSNAININQHLVVKHLPRIASDHCPILLNLFDQLQKKSSIKFEDIWVSYQTSYAVVEKAWKKKDTDSVNNILNYKLKRTFKSLFFWRKAKLKNLNQLKDTLKLEILQLQIKEAEVGPKKKLFVLGTGWASTSFLKYLDTSLYDVRVVSLCNFFAFTTLLPSITCGTVEPSSIVKPIRNIMRKAECYNIDPTNKNVLCRSTIGTNLDGNGEFELGYGYLVVALGAMQNAFNTPGVSEHCHFLKQTLIRSISVWKDVEVSQGIRRSVMNCFQKASLPDLSEEERIKNLHFVVIGSGPTTVEFTIEVHDFLQEDLSRLYPNALEFVRLSLIEAGKHILTLFDKKITQFVEEKFQSDCIDVKTNFKVVKVSGDAITKENSYTGEANVPYGLDVWSTGIGTCRIIFDFLKQIDQNIYALDDCATIAQIKFMEDILSIFRVADKDNSGTLTVKEIKDVLEDIERYPKVALYLKTKQMKDFLDLLEESEGDVMKESVEQDIERFKKALS
ncbi:hypothetical protein KFK09_029338 [Dendrobium nobile]|uniref:EF-hand domain-containing protein n=1 Tax=Dendrobium nobile TaxID=94219 RepID=A0A8T3A124_DENNO|nr:hypothetical protein KFK09_029338 [Dendrobium nobile]